MSNNNIFFIGMHNKIYPANTDGGKVKLKNGITAVSRLDYIKNWSIYCQNFQE